MPWEDFSRIFKRVDICDRTTRRDLKLDIYEDMGMCGMLVGCLGGLAKWPSKIKQDLLPTWASGLCYWPFVDLLVYSFLPIVWIPLAYNFASFVWTIYLSIQASRTVAA